MVFQNGESVVMKLTGRTAIVTGAARGIGENIAMRFGREGANVVVTARSTEAINHVAQQIRDAGQDALAAFGRSNPLFD